MGNAGLEVGSEALAGLLDAFGKGNIVDPRLEREGLERHARELTERWDHRFPGFPQHCFPFTSFRGLGYRGKRDEYLKSIIVQLLNAHDDVNKTIVNPACVAGRHARDLASRLASVRIIGTDIDPRGVWLYARVLRTCTADNFEFIKDDIFDPKLDVTPTAVVFFGACGSVSDAAMDYAIDSHSPYLMCRTCCHHNIGGNMELTGRHSFLNWFFRLRNWGLSYYRKKEKYAGFYFSDKHSRAQYPRSNAARGMSNSEVFMEVSRNSTESDVCRTIIDLDRYLRLAEKGYNVWYRGELFVAERAVSNRTLCPGSPHTISV